MTNPYHLHLGDCLGVMRSLDDASVDSIVTDPPYHLTQVSRGSHTRNPQTPYERARIGDRGFMGHQWDGGDIAFRVELWAEALRVLKPGGHLLAFSGARTYHRMACAIEDAGFEIRDQTMWLYGSGFPKSHNIGEGRGTALKPAHEPICVARKPLAGTVAANVLAYGVGALNIDVCRIGGVDGRWPANVIHDGSDEVLAAFPDAPGQLANAAEGGDRRKTQNVYGAMLRGSNGTAPHIEADKSAARFFYCAKASRADRNEGLMSRAEPVVAANATMRDREAADWSERNGNHHPTVKPTDLMAYLCRLVTAAGGTVLDPFMGSGSTGKAAIREGFRFIGIDMTPEYVEIARARIAHEYSTIQQAAADAARQPALFENAA